MRITQWLNGHINGHYSLETSKQVAQCLINRGYEVREMYEINTLVVFSPSYNNERGN